MAGDSMLLMHSVFLPRRGLQATADVCTLTSSLKLEPTHGLRANSQLDQLGPSSRPTMVAPQE